MDSDEERRALLERLNAHGQQFLDAFASPTEPRKKKRRLNTHFGEESPRSASHSEHETDDSGDEEDWTGFGEGGEVSSASESENDWQEEEEDFHEDFDHDDEFRSDGPSKRPEVIIFNGTSSGKPTEVATLTKAQRKAFMSSKVSKLRSDDIPVVPRNPLDPEEEAEKEEERTNKHNDALLHRLVHHQLLSGSLKPDRSLTPAQRRKALAGRVMEIIGDSKLGKGEKDVRTSEMNHASKNVRLGLKRKKEERSAAELEEVKNLGNYHPILKKLYDTAAGEKDVKKKRTRGLKMGVGKFSSGILKLGKDEIASIQESSGPSRRGGGGGRGKGRGRGRPGRR